MPKGTLANLNPNLHYNESWLSGSNIALYSEGPGFICELRDLSSLSRIFVVFVSPPTCRKNTWNWATTASLHTLYNLSFN